MNAHVSPAYSQVMTDAYATPDAVRAALTPSAAAVSRAKFRDALIAKNGGTLIDHGAKSRRRKTAGKKAGGKNRRGGTAR